MHSFIQFSFSDEETEGQDLNDFDVSLVSCSASMKFHIYQFLKIRFVLLFQAAGTRGECVGNIIFII